MLAHTFIVLALAGLSGPTDDAELQKLEGTWQAVKIVNDGQEGNAEALKSQRLIIKADRYTLEQPDGEIRGFLTLDPSKSPAQMDASYNDPDGGSGTVECIYKLEDDRLTICWSDSGDRPDAFSAEAGTARRLMVLERKKAEGQ